MLHVAITATRFMPDPRRRSKQETARVDRAPVAIVRNPDLETTISGRAAGHRKYGRGSKFVGPFPWRSGHAPIQRAS